jgi:HK97 family phage portal protein
MSILSRAAKAISQAVMRFASSSSWSMLLLNRGRFDYASHVGDGRQSSAVVACMNWICRTFPEAPVMVLERQRDGTETPLVDHPLLDLLTTPNDYYSGEMLMRATLADWTASGDAYWVKIRNRYGAPVQLWWVPQALMAPAWPSNDPTVYISHYEYRVGGEVFTYAPADVVHFRNGLDPQNTRKGLSPLASLLREVFTDEEAGSFSASLLRNLGVPGVIISPDDDNVELNSGDAEAVKSDFKAKFGGENRGEPMVLPAKTKVQVLSFNPQQMDLKGMRRLPEERVSAVLGVPAIVAGLGAGLDRSTFANMSEAREMAYESNIIPNQRLIGAELRAQLLPDYGDTKRLRVAFDTKNVRVLQEDQNKLWTRVDTAVRGGWLKVGRAKEMVGETAEPGDDIYLRSSSVTPEGPDAPAPEPVPAALAAAATKPPAQDQAAGDMPSPEDMPASGKSRPSGTQTKASRAKLVRRLQRQAESLTRAFAGDLEQAFQDLGGKVKLHVGKATGKTITDLGHITGELADGTPVWVEAPDMSKALRTIYEANFGLILEGTAGTIAAYLGVPVGVDLEDPRARELIRKWATRKGLADVNQQTREAILQALADGRAAGEGADDLAFRIRGMVEGRGMYPGVYQEAHDLAIANGASEEYASQAGDRAARQYRAETIARSETKTAQNLSSVEAYINSEVVDGVIVYDGTDDDDACKEANGQEWTFEQALERPLEHPRCVRNFAPKVRKTVA